MSRYRVYIAGRMTGQPNFGFPDFEDGETRVRAHGDEPVSPHRLNIDRGWVVVERNPSGKIILASATKQCPRYDEMLAEDFKNLATCDAIYMLPGWKGGHGCIRELREAMRLGLRVWGPVNERLDVLDWLSAHPTSQPLVGLVGTAQSGKDTVAGMLGYRRQAFADPLKALAVACGPEFLDARIGERYDLGTFVTEDGWEYAKAKVPGVREFLQDLGVGVRDVLGYDTWVDTAFAGYDATQATAFTDVRFPNEIAAIRERGGIICHVIRPGVTMPNTHVSETAWRRCSPEYQIMNDGSLEDLATRAVQLDTYLRRNPV